VERGVAEIERLAGTPGIRGIMIPTMWHQRKAYNDPSYEPVWAAAAANGLVVHVHSGEAPREEYGDDIGPYLAEVAWWSARPISFLLFGGVFERHPDLKFCVTEGAAYWASDMMWKWDQYFGGGHTTAKLAHLMKGKISKLPSDYFGTNIFIGASTMSREEIRRRYVIGCDVMMWGTDYPHPEGTWPDTVGVLKRSFHDVPVDDTAKLVGLTAGACYGMDMTALREIADHIGPTPEDLGQDPSLLADPDEVANARWWKEEYGVKVI
jgi:predicted TIM-barrel fold metal-dependent hydrolase